MPAHERTPLTTHQEPERVVALDALRAIAMLLGVVLHACAPYMAVPLRGLIMPLQQPAPTRAADVVLWALHIFRVPLFFIVAGWAGAAMLSRRGPEAFLRNRWRRVALPLLIGFPIITIAMYPVWLWGWVERGWASWGHLGALTYGPELERAVWGLHHFWFLEYLLVYGLLLCCTRRRALGGRAVAWPMVVAVIASIACVSARPAWFLDFENAYVPRLAPLAYYGSFFFGGVVLRRIGAQSKWWGRSCVPLLAIGGALGALAIIRILHEVSTTDHGPRQGVMADASPASRLTFGALIAASAWCLSLGLTGGAIVLVKRLGTLGRFLVDASYWVYLTHMLWVGLAVMALQDAPWRGEVKAAVVACAAGAAALLTFVPVRRTRLGRWLGADTLRSESARAREEKIGG